MTSLPETPSKNARKEIPPDLPVGKHIFKAFDSLPKSKDGTPRTVTGSTVRQLLKDATSHTVTGSTVRQLFPDQQPNHSKLSNTSKPHNNNPDSKGGDKKQCNKKLDEPTFSVYIRYECRLLKRLIVNPKTTTRDLGFAVEQLFGLPKGEARLGNQATKSLITRNSDCLEKLGLQSGYVIDVFHHSIRQRSRCRVDKDTIKICLSFNNDTIGYLYAQPNQTFQVAIFDSLKFWFGQDRENLKFFAGKTYTIEEKEIEDTTPQRFSARRYSVPSIGNWGMHLQLSVLGIEEGTTINIIPVNVLQSSGGLVPHAQSG